jgi:3-isopropylmalate dehydrogenase
MKLLVLPCDGIGPEIISASMQVLETASSRFGLDLSFNYDDVGFVSLEKHGTTLRESVLDRARQDYDGVILGTQSHADYPAPEKGGRNVSAGFRIGLDLYANVRPARTRSFIPSNMKPGKSMDLVIMREATEGFYPDRNMHLGWAELMPSPDMAISLRKITAHCSNRIARRSFELAMKRRKKVTAVHKVNSFHQTDGLFLREVRKVAAEFPEVILDDLLIDASTAHLVRNPERFDVICATNFYGDIISDLASELSGSLGLAGSMMASDTHCCAQAQHGSAPDLQNLDRANPVSMMLSCGMLLQWIGEKRGLPKFEEAFAAIDGAIDTVLQDPASRTPDLDGKAGTKKFGSLVADVLARG